MNVCRNQNHAFISQQAYHNKGHLLDSSQVSANTRHFRPLGRRRNIPLNPNNNQKNLTNTITEDVKQQYSQNTIHAFFYKQHFYKQRQAENGYKSSKS